MENHHPSSLFSSSLPFFLFSSLIFILFISQVLKLLAKKSKATSKKTKPNLPPGPWTLPIIGSIHHFIGNSLPHRCMRDLARKYGPLMHLKLGETSVMVVSSPEVAKEVFKKYDVNFSERPKHLGADILTYGSTNIATSQYGGYWKQLRKIATMELLSPKRVSSFKSIREEEDLFGAGIETSSGVIEWTMSELMKNPRAMARAQEEVRTVFGVNGFTNEPSSPSLEKLTYLKAVIKETMRLHPPFPLLLPRECRETCEINGYTIAAGTQVIVNAWAIGRDPKHWGGEEDAEIFRPERFLESSIDYKGSDVEFIPFGAGRRICPGIYFAVASIESCVAQLLYYFDWKVPEDGEMDMSEYFGSTARRKNDLILVPIPWKNK
ncbi:hypothetical protein PIB30_036147 [Stylosanthes scabra]|uniref:Uncharacterized protein n=1 Tax=Stylosanthes scabra TaxID=79078 RepID=A0ABU6YC41_9FABA|nr:hypothetical protein [Stylosanthes scabra]